MIINVGRIKYSYLDDGKYFREYNNDYDLSIEDIDLRVKDLESNEYVDIDFNENDIKTIIEDSKNEDYDMIISYIEDITGEYFTIENKDLVRVIGDLEREYKKEYREQQISSILD